MQLETLKQGLKLFIIKEKLLQKKRLRKTLSMTMTKQYIYLILTANTIWMEILNIILLD